MKTEGLEEKGGRPFLLGQRIRDHQKEAVDVMGRERKYLQELERCELQ